jgi:sporulation protein YlmC with PRC-barrel domain
MRTSSNMQHSVKSLIGYPVYATNGWIGSLYDFYFDDETWGIRHAVIRAGHRILSRKVLISPGELGRPDLESRSFRVDLTKEHVRNSPVTNTRKPVSRQQLDLLHSHYGWPAWILAGGMNPAPFTVPPVPVEELEHIESLRREADIHLRSIREVVRYSVQGIGSRTGYLSDMVVNVRTWVIACLMVTTRGWLRGTGILISPWLVREIRWGDRTVSANVDLTLLRGNQRHDSVLTPGSECDTKLSGFDDSMGQ